MKLLFNINDSVWVKLTESGREWYKAEYQKRTGVDSLPRIQEVNGWSRWQLWDLMNMFGERLVMGFDLPFDTEMSLVDPNR